MLAQNNEPQIQQNPDLDSGDIIGSHKDRLLQMNLMNSAEVDLIVDALISSPKIVENILGKSVYTKILQENPNIFSPKKQLYNKNNEKEFVDFSITYIENQKEAFIKNQKTIQKEKIKQDTVAELQKKLSDSSLDQKKGEIKEARACLQKIKEKKHHGRSFLCSLGKIDPSLLECTEKLAQFFVEYTPAEKKKYLLYQKKYPNKNQFSFLKENGDPMLDSIESLISTLQKKITSSISQKKQKIEHTLKVPEKEPIVIFSKQQLDLRRQEAEIAYSNHIKEGTDTHYSEKERLQAEQIRSYFFQKNATATCPSFEPKDLQEEKLTSPKDLHDGGTTALKKNSTIFVDKPVIDLVAFNQKKLASYFLSGERNMRDYLLNRLSEYFAMEIIPVLLAPYTKNISNIKIIKTSAQDDTFGGADFVITGAGKQGTYEEWLDLIISDNEGNIAKKRKEAKKKSFLIDSFFNDLKDENKLYTGYQNTKEIIALEPVMFYTLFTQFIHNLKTYGSILGSKYKNLSEYFDKEVSTHYSSFEQLYKNAYKTLYKKNPTGEYSFDHTTLINKINTDITKLFSTN